MIQTQEQIQKRVQEYDEPAALARMKQLEETLNKLKLHLHDLKSHEQQQNLQKVEIFAEDCAQAKLRLSKYDCRTITSLDIFIKNEKYAKWLQLLREYEKNAKDAANGINKQNVFEGMQFSSPPPGVLLTFRVVLLLLGEINQTADRQKIWKRSKVVLLGSPAWIPRLDNFQNPVIPEKIIKIVTEIVQNPYHKFTHHIQLVNCVYGPLISSGFLTANTKSVFLKQCIESTKELMDQISYCSNATHLTLQINFPEWSNFELQKMANSLNKLKNLRQLKINRQYLILNC